MGLVDCELLCVKLLECVLLEEALKHRVGVGLREAERDAVEHTEREGLRESEGVDVEVGVEDLHCV